MNDNRKLYISNGIIKHHQWTRTSIASILLLISIMIAFVSSPYAAQAAQAESAYRGTDTSLSALAVKKGFSDVPVEHWAYETIHALASQGIINGVSEGKFEPDTATSRAAFSVMLARALKLKPTGTSPFRDVLPGEWHAEAITALSEIGLIEGTAPNYFSPDRAITREEVAALIVRAAEYKTGSTLTMGNGLGQFYDWMEVSDWAINTLNKAILAGLIKGTSAVKIQPQLHSNRAQTAQFIQHLLTFLQGPEASNS